MLQKLDLEGCESIEGEFQPCLASSVRPTNTIEHLSCGPSRKTDLLPRFPECLLCLVGDVGKVQWPAGLQELWLQGCSGIFGKFYRHLTSFARSANIFEHLSCGPSRKNDLHPAFFRPLFLLVLGPFERFPGDISTVKWPEGLQYLRLDWTKVSGASSVHFCRFYVPGELSLRAAPSR